VHSLEEHCRVSAVCRLSLLLQVQNNVHAGDTGIHAGYHAHLWRTALPEMRPGSWAV
jgi:hypothetical protein